MQRTDGTGLGTPPPPSNSVHPGCDAVRGQAAQAQGLTPLSYRDRFNLSRAGSRTGINILRNERRNPMASGVYSSISSLSSLLGSPSSLSSPLTPSSAAYRDSPPGRKSIDGHYYVRVQTPRSPYTFSVGLTKETDPLFLEAMDLHLHYPQQSSSHSDFHSNQQPPICEGTAPPASLFSFSRMKSRQRTVRNLRLVYIVTFAVLVVSGVLLGWASLNRRQQVTTWLAFKEPWGQPVSVVKGWWVGDSRGRGSDSKSTSLVTESHVATGITTNPLSIPTTTVSTKKRIEINVMPRPRLPDTSDKETKYIGFLPHSGYHNQRGSLENALFLGHLLNRTVLLPPVWVGWPTPTMFYERLQAKWTEMVFRYQDSFGFHDPLTSVLFRPPNPPYRATQEYSGDGIDGAGDSGGADGNKELMRGSFDFLKEKDQVELTADEHVSNDQNHSGIDTSSPITRQNSSLTAADCKSYSRECQHTYQDTFLAWDSLINVDQLAGITKVVDRWDMREKSIENLLQVERDEILVILDQSRMDLSFQFTGNNGTSNKNGNGSVENLLDHLILDHNINHHTHNNATQKTPPHSWNRQVSIEVLERLPQKVILIGSMFGHSRVKSMSEDQERVREKIRRSTVFRNPWILKPANEVSRRLGGVGNYVGVHARVGEAHFARQAETNMRDAWKTLTRNMGVDEKVMDTVWTRFDQERASRGPQSLKRWSSLPKPQHQVVRRSLHTIRSPEQMEMSSWVDDFAKRGGEEEDVNTLSPSSMTRFADYKTPFKRAPVKSTSQLVNLRCRRSLHTESERLVFNTPLYLATDARHPESEPSLQVFFETFPCTFILEDFDVSLLEVNDGVTVESIQEMKSLVNQADGVVLGRLFLPFLEACIAAKGGQVVGTRQSTFSGFAAGVLHDLYMEEARGVDISP